MIAITSASPLIDNCQIQYTDTTGIYVENTADLLIQNCLISDNSASGGGGGLSLNDSTCTLTDNTISDNSASGGGGLSLNDSTCTLTGNTISDNSASGSGGGLYLNDSTCTLTGNTISDNSASGSGGGLYLNDSTCTLTGNAISDNSASGPGGGLHFNFSTCTLTGNVISDNSASQGGAINGAFVKTFNLSSNTITTNTSNVSKGSAIYISSFYIDYVRKIEENLITGNYSTSTNNSSAIYLNENDFDSFTKNTIRDNNTTYDLEVGFSSGKSLIAIGNDWGSTDTNTILGKIYDFFDNSAKGDVDFGSPLSQPDEGVPPLSPTGLAATVNTAINLSWNANAESDISGYLIYYGTTSGASYNGTGASGGDSPISVAANVNSYSLSGLTSGQDYYLAIAAKDKGSDDTANTSDDQIGARSDEVSVTLTASAIASLSLAPSTASVSIGQTQTFTVSAVGNNSSPVAITASEVDWTVSGGVGTIDGAGVFTAATAGTGQVTAALKTNSTITTTTGNITIPIPPPQVTSISPTHGLVSDSVTITGQNFGSAEGSSAVTFNNVAATVTSWSATQISVSVPAGSTTGNLVVTVGSQSSSGVTFTLDSVVNNITKIQVSNLTSTSSTITFITDGNAVANIDYGITTSLGTQVTENGGARRLHAVDITGLNADTTYYYDIYAGGITDDNSTNHHTFHTTKVGNGSPFTLFGRVLASDNSTAADGVLVHVTVTDSSDLVSKQLSALTNSNGYWFFDLGNLKDMTSANHVFSYTASDTIDISVDGSATNGIGIATKTVGTSPQNAGTITLQVDITQTVSLMPGLNLITLSLTPTSSQTSHGLLSSITSAKEIFSWGEVVGGQALSMPLAQHREPTSPWLWVKGTC